MRAWALALTVSTVLTLTAIALPARAATQIGFKDHSYAGFNAETAGGAITGQKPESKLWYNAGTWWAAMLSPAQNGAHTIWRLANNTWVDTGTLVDGRASTKEDVLSLGSKLYILSRSSTTSSPNRLRRYTFSGSSYTVDAGFPVDVPGGGMETATIARDGTGTLWISYTSGNSGGNTVLVAHTTGGSDTTWGAAFTPSVGSSTSLSADDISAVISFTDATGPAIGVMYSNQNQNADYFAVHRDGANDATWTVETALTGSHEADDHLNLKTTEGRVYAVVKTSQTKSNNPLVRLLLRSTSGSWSKSPVALVRDGNTRPITMLQLDPANRLIYVFMTIGEGAAARGIVYRTSPMDGGINFGNTTTFIQGPGSEVINDATSMKANADASTGIVVMASDGNNYWWNKLGGSGPSNLPPTATNGSGTTAEDTAATLTLSSSDPDNCELTYSIVTPPAHGTLGTISNLACTAGSPNHDTAQVFYTPAANYNGPDPFTFKVNDGIVDSNTATESITVTAVNDVPVATAGSATAPEDTATQIVLSGTDPETCNLGFSIVTGPAHGSLGSITLLSCVAGSPNSDTARVTYTSAANYNGPDAFTFKVNDGAVDSPAATMSITVSPVNDLPTASPVTTSTSEDTPATVTLAGSDIETCDLLFSIVTGPSHGSLGAISPQTCVLGSPSTDSAQVTYTPAANYNGSDSFTYRTNDGTGDSTNATVFFTVNSVNDVPIATASSGTTAQDTPVTLSLAGTDVETCEVGFSVVTAPTHGSLGSIVSQACAPGTPNTDHAQVVYTPTAGYNGPDSFTFKINDGFADSSPAAMSLTVTPPGNTPPTAISSSLTTNHDTAGTVSLSGTDPETCQLTFSIGTAPLHGTLGLITDAGCTTGSPNVDGAQVVYTPAAGYSGPDSFTFKVNDGTADSSAATVSITVTPPPNTPPTANAGSDSTNQGTPVTLSLSGTDPETCELTFSVDTAPAHGTLGSFTNAACTAGSPNSDGAQVVYTPTAGYSGPDSFKFKVNDGAADSTAATISLTVIAVNQAPTANGGSASTNQDTPLTVSVSGTDPETCELTFSVDTAPLHGTLGTFTDAACATGSPNADGAQIVYTPTAGYFGSDSFKFKVNDGLLDSTAATVTLTVNPPANTPPTAYAGSASTTLNTPATVSVSGSDPETCELTFSVDTAPAHGTLGSFTNAACTAGSPNSDGAQVVYTPTAGYTGPDSFKFKVNDGFADSTAATVTLTVNPPANTAPTATAGSATTTQNTPVTVNLAGTDAENCELTFSIDTAPLHGGLGSITAQACTPGTPKTDHAQVVYTPAAGYTGSDSFKFKVNDGLLDSSAATVSITVTAAPTQITLRSASSGVNPTATTLVIPAPAGVQAGDFLLALIDARGNPNFTPPAGWTLLRMDISGFTLRQAVYYKVAASEPASYTWTLSNSQAAAGGILAYTGVNTANPIDAHSGAISSVASGKNAVAPSVTTDVNGAMIVGLYGVANNTSFTPPTGMTERFDVVSNAGTYPMASEAADGLQATAGATGDRTAVSGTTGWNIGQLVALRPSGS